MIGTPAPTAAAEIENLIGFFVNTLALRLDLSGSPTVSELLDAGQGAGSGRAAASGHSFEQVVETGAAGAQPGPQSAVPGHVRLAERGSEGSLELPGLELKPLQSSPHRVAKFDLTLSLQEAGDTIAGGIEYATSLFERATIERYLGYFRNLLEAMVADDTQAVDRLPMLPASERHRVLYEWNDTKTEYPADKCVHRAVRGAGGEDPGSGGGGLRGGVAQLCGAERRANQLAHYLSELGVRPDDRVAICVERGLEMIVACWRCSRPAAPMCRSTRHTHSKGYTSYLETAVQLQCLHRGSSQNCSRNSAMPRL